MMAESPIAQVKHLPPKQLALIAGVGILAGLYLRKRAKSKTSNAPAALVAAVPDTGLASSSTGPYAGSTGGTTGGTSTDNLATRDTGGNTISLPVQSWIVGGPGGTQYVTDGTNLTPYNPGGGVTVPAPVPAVQSTGTLYGPNGYVPSPRDITLTEMDRQAAQYVQNSQTAAAANPTVFSPNAQGWVSQPIATQPFDPVQAQADIGSMFGGNASMVRNG